TRKRLPSGVVGLDTILHGGFFPGDIYLIIGQPGTGKTILASQLCFNHIQAGGQALYVTMLAETHSGLLGHLQSLAYFDETLIPEKFYLVSGYPVLADQGLDGVRKQIHQMVRQHHATMLVLEGLETVEASAPSALALKQFLLDLHAFMSAQGCTTFLVSSQASPSSSSPEHAMVDGLLNLRHLRVEMRAFREIEVKKLRGSRYMEGGHFFRISEAGVTIYPRTESVLAMPSSIAVPSSKRLGLGLENLDAMLQGGLPAGSTTMLLGAPGSGKTILSSHFLSQCQKENDKGLYFGFYETAPQLLDKARLLGIDLKSCVENGMLEIVWRSPIEDNLDGLVQELLERVTQNGVRRLVIDGLEGFESASLYPGRVHRLFVALGNELRALGVTTLFTIEAQNRFGPELEVPIHAAGLMADNIILLRYVALRSELYRVLSMVKMRSSAYDPAVREFKISPRGIEVASTVESAEAILREVADPSAAPPPSTDL
ncbi:MAG: recombinase RecA, partial [Ardenticatenales bacterium]|nr:recombinase RecA [Ardenticatenales bacterium]